MPKLDPETCLYAYKDSVHTASFTSLPSAISFLVSASKTQKVDHAFILDRFLGIGYEATLELDSGCPVQRIFITSEGREVMTIDTDILNRWT